MEDYEIAMEKLKSCLENMVETDWEEIKDIVHHPEWSPGHKEQLEKRNHRIRLLNTKTGNLK